MRVEALGEIYNLSMVSRPVLLKIKGKCWIVILSGVKKVKKKIYLNEIGQILVSGGLDGWKWMREAGPDRFVDYPAGKTLK